MHICIIRPGALGDTLLALPVIQALREHKTIERVTFVGQAAFAPLLLATGLVTSYLDYEDTCWGQLFLPQGIRHPELRALLADCQLVVCWLRDPDGLITQNLRAATPGRVVVTPGRPGEHTGMHTSTYLASTLGLTLPAEPHLTLAPSTTPQVEANPHFFAIHPGSGGARKCWSLQGYAEVIQALWQHDIPVLLLAGPADSDRLAELRQLLPTPPPGLLTLLENAPLLQVAHALQHCWAYLGNDSGVTHLAALLGIPTTALFIASDPRAWHPLGRSVQIIAAQELGVLSVSEVLTALESFLI
ncbi:glycosyl transferase [Ktedonobacter sp. SOSP1-52]|uniref:glycosyltransferase family 9 protein n=1 Tax=Ktedonobacter sp. SOSP1-52 TaxID=2778366 RepID=UPI0019164BA0|nr:glycosyltransferase family 9 protein [Ktedonobacter sp. SOSP1-52]GHO69479.1 glycosyl transferase [Ktedonobacter sp. SOSP1-52]